MSQAHRPKACAAPQRHCPRRYSIGANGMPPHTPKALAWKARRPAQPTGATKIGEKPEGGLLPKPARTPTEMPLIGE